MTEEMTAPPLPELRPGVGNAYVNGWRQTWKWFLDLLLAGIVYIAMVIAVGLIVGVIFSLGWANSFSSTFDMFGTSAATATISWGAQAVTGVLDIVYYTPLLYGLLFIALLAARARQPELANLFIVFKSNYLNVIVVGILFWLIFSLPTLIIGWILAVVWPLGIVLTIIWVVVAIILYCRLLFVPFLLTDKRLGAVEAIRTSWEWSRGHALENFLILLLAIPITIAGVIVFVVGVIPAIMWVALAVSSQYHAVSLEKENPVAYPSPMVP
jgi:hypothetical protein